MKRSVCQCVYRVFHIGECGVHHKVGDCSTEQVSHQGGLQVQVLVQVIQRVQNILQAVQAVLFPSSLSVVHTTVKGLVSKWQIGTQITSVFK